MVVITAKVYIRDTCNPDVPGDCAPVIEVEGASELEGLVSQHGIAFEEPLQEQEDVFVDEVVEDEDEDEDELEADETPEDQLKCPLEPELEWDESICGEIERRILSKVFGE